MILYPYKTASKSAKQIAEATGAYMVGRDIQLGTPNKKIVVVNWGSGEAPAGFTYINPPSGVNNAVNKLRTFRCLAEAGVSTPEWTTEKSVALAWIAQGHKVCARTRLEGHDGQGLSIHQFGGIPLVDAKLYTKFITATSAEYRVSVVGDTAIAVQKKVPVPGFAGPYNHQVKTSGGGYGLHLESNMDQYHLIKGMSVKAVKALGLDMGGVDILDNGMVLEVNTAPELTPTLIERYSEHITNLWAKKVEEVHAS